MSEQAEGWHTDASGLRVKKWDPHRETRRRALEPPRLVLLGHQPPLVGHLLTQHVFAL